MLNLQDPAIAVEVAENGFIIGWKEYREDFVKTGRVTYIKAVAKNIDDLQEIIVNALKRHEQGKPA